MFAQKAARSVVEIQPNINNTADAAVLLECLGYRIEILVQHGFADFYALANYICTFLDIYEIRQKSTEFYIKTFFMEIPKISKRVEESIGLIFPGLGSIALLFFTGVSLWMAIGFPIKTTTVFVLGVFFGVIMTAGTLQIIDRSFMYYYEQTNMSEIKRLLRRSYCMTGIILLMAAGIIYTIGYVEKFSFHLLSLTIISMVTVSFHRTSYMIIYALKKVNVLIASYSLAFATLLFTYYFGQHLIPSGITRYFAGLVFAFVVLSIFSIYQHYKLMKQSIEPPGEKPHFYKPLSITKETIRSKFGVQLWESIPYALYNVFYFIMMFSDRILSWIYNPVVLNGNLGLPLAFNSTYHIGADMALIVLMPASIIQYVIMMPIYIVLNNINIRTKISQQNLVNAFIQRLYRKVMLVSLISSVATALILNQLAPTMMIHLGVAQTSINVLQIASVANIFICIFTANGLFLTWLNKTKFLLIVLMVSSTIVLTYGILSDHRELQNLTLGYLVASLFAAITSTIYINKTLKRAASIIFARSY